MDVDDEENELDNEISSRESTPELLRLSTPEPPVWSPISSEDEVEDWDEGSVDEADDSSIQMEHINKIIEGNEKANRLEELDENMAVMKWIRFKLIWRQC